MRFKSLALFACWVLVLLFAVLLDLTDEDVGPSENQATTGSLGSFTAFDPVASQSLQSQLAP